MTGKAVKSFDVKQKRTTNDLFRDILYFLVFNHGSNITNLMYKANLSHSQMKAYLSNLYNKGFITFEKIYSEDRFMSSAVRNKVFITEKGLNYLIELLIIERLIRGEALLGGIK